MTNSKVSTWQAVSKTGLGQRPRRGTVLPTTSKLRILWCLVARKSTHPVVRSIYRTAASRVITASLIMTECSIPSGPMASVSVQAEWSVFSGGMVRSEMTKLASSSKLVAPSCRRARSPAAWGQRNLVAHVHMAARNHGGQGANKSQGG